MRDWKGEIAQAVLIGSILAAAAAGGWLALAVKVRAHEWYPVECCSGHDCAPIPAEQVRLTPQGWIWRNDHGAQLFSFDSDRLRASPDAQFHGCELPLSKEKRCLFVTGGTS